ncbi:hypothetical protein [uncultured Bacteroides sp.]|uniref:hypothetical protein n=1 Tax=uncultured Bacteroides sp. TaxID=162156 RepID=UPI002AA7FB8B|nr:hypothetical protein [uncultured Bacteroides sp.]
MKQEFILPKGVNKITIEIDKGMAIITVGKAKCLEYHNKLTNHIESSPVVGNMAILWDKADPKNAIIATLQDWESVDINVRYKGGGEWFDNAIRFRDEEQYNAIRGYETTE